MKELSWHFGKHLLTRYFLPLIITLLQIFLFFFTIYLLLLPFSLVFTLIVISLVFTILQLLLMCIAEPRDPSTVLYVLFKHSEIFRCLYHLRLEPLLYVGHRVLLLVSIIHIVIGHLYFTNCLNLINHFTLVLYQPLFMLLLLFGIFQSQQISVYIFVLLSIIL